MSPALIFGVIVLCAALCVTGIVLGVGLVRVRKANRELERSLKAATEAQHAKDSLLTQRSELDTIKDEFISTVSHELRTPLTSIRGALGLLSAGLMGTMDAKAQNLLRIAVTNTDRLIRLINDILDLERMQSGRAPLHIRRCSLRDLLQQSIETMNAMADAAQVSLALDLAASSDAVWFDGDSDRILQVLTNLLSNAIKFSPTAAPSSSALRPTTNSSSSASPTSVAASRSTSSTPSSTASSRSRHPTPGKKAAPASASLSAAPSSTSTTAASGQNRTFSRAAAPAPRSS